MSTSLILNEIHTFVEIVEGLAWISVTVLGVIVHGFMKDIKVKLLEMKLETTKLHATKEDLLAVSTNMNNRMNSLEKRTTQSEKDISSLQARK